jgi:CubicO group peptidase (beta-lactamase class C family)
MRLITKAAGAMAAAVLSALVSFASHAQSQSPDLNDIADLEVFIDGVMKAHMDTLRIPTAVISIVKDGQPLFAKGYGYADIGKRTAVDPATTMFRIGSITKTFTWTAVMQLVEQGKLDLDADVNLYLKEPKIPASYPQPITLRHMMTHTTGFEEGFLGYLRADPVTDKSMTKMLTAHMPARVRAPGLLPSYSNYATALAGLIVENVSGVPYDEYIRRHIFEPLDMRYATVEEVVPERLKPHLVTGYHNRDGYYEPGRYETIGGFRAAGSASVSAGDMAHFMIAHLQDGRYGEARILQPASARSMHATAFQSDRRLPGITLGFYEHRLNGVRIVAHSGDSAMFHAYLYLVPEKNLGIFVDYIGDGGQTARDGLMEALFDRYFPATQIAERQSGLSAAEASKRYGGAYKFIRRNYTDIDKALFLSDQVVVSARDEGRLLVSLPALDNVQWLFEPIGPDLFRQLGGKREIAFRVDAAGRSTHMFLDLLPVIALDRTAWYEQQSFWYPLLALAAILLLSALVLPLYRWREVTALPREPRRSIVLAVATAGWLLLTIVAIAAAASSTTDPLAWHIPTALKVALAMPLVFVALAVLMSVAALRLWQGRQLTRTARVHYTLVAIAALVISVFLYQWNLLGWQFG